MIQYFVQMQFYKQLTRSEHSQYLKCLPNCKHLVTKSSKIVPIKLFMPKISNQTILTTKAQDNLRNYQSTTDPILVLNILCDLKQITPNIKSQRKGCSLVTEWSRF